MKNPLRENALKKYKANKIYSWQLGILSGIFLGAVILSNIVTGGISLLLIPLVIFPFLYAVLFGYLSLQLDKGVTLKDFLFRYRSFFTPHNRGSFGIVNSLLFALLGELIVTFVVSGFSVAILRFVNPDYYTTLVNNVYELFATETAQEVIDLIGEDLYLTVEMGLYVIGMVGGLVVTTIFVVLTTRNAMSIYFRAAMVKSSPMFIDRVATQTIKRNKKAINKDYLSLNFPIIIIFVLGFVITGVIGFIYYPDSAVMTVVAISASLALCSFFFPFYFANNEALYEKYHMLFRKTSNDIAREMYQTLENRIQLSEEEKKRVQESLDKFNSLSDDQQDQSDDEQK